MTITVCHPSCLPCLGRSKGSHHADRFEEDGKTWELQRHVSFVDCPGHDILMATMLNGAAVSGEHKRKNARVLQVEAEGNNRRKVG